MRVTLSEAEHFVQTPNVFALLFNLFPGRSADPPGFDFCLDNRKHLGPLTASELSQLNVPFDPSENNAHGAISEGFFQRCERAVDERLEPRLVAECGCAVA